MLSVKSVKVEHVQDWLNAALAVILFVSPKVGPGGAAKHPRTSSLPTSGCAIISLMLIRTDQVIQQ